MRCNIKRCSQPNRPSLRLLVVIGAAFPAAIRFQSQFFRSSNMSISMTHLARVLSVYPSLPPPIASSPSFVSRFRPGFWHVSSIQLRNPCLPAWAGTPARPQIHYCSVVAVIAIEGRPTGLWHVCRYPLTPIFAVPCRNCFSRYKPFKWDESLLNQRL